MADSPPLRLPPDASPDEAAAITAAIEALLATEARAREEADGEGEAWTGRRFAFAGRLAKVNGPSVRVPAGAPANPWTAAGRVERF